MPKMQLDTLPMIMQFLWWLLEVFEFWRSVEQNLGMLPFREWRRCVCLPKEAHRLLVTELFAKILHVELIILDALIRGRLIKIPISMK